ncbi:hypothetical protein ACMU_19045 [Actibacterium mucosum KCTC 23349]|uniref:HTH lysR-type domain-containing protein n=2 Tax=Actibacterium TaxID=1433986 RepID=A0A037ZFK5_9RHOB|nr:hypothetical protein ACMU_19045 [Actibacterium mucosum KCTC 23349]
MNWDDLKFFLAVARAGSFHRAAGTMGANRTTVARRLDALEAAIGTRLFDRMPTGLTLTATGAELIPHAERVEAEVAAAARLLAGRDAALVGPVRLSMPHFLARTLVMDLLTGFATDNPGVDLRIDLDRRPVSLALREADVTLRFARAVDGDVLGRRLATCSRAAYCAPSLAQRMADNGGTGLHWIGSTEPDEADTADWIAASAFPNARLRHRMTEGATQIAFARAGAGLTMLPCFVGDAEPGLVRAPFQTPQPDRSLWLLLHRDLRQVARVRQLVDHLAAGIIAARPRMEAV